MTAPAALLPVRLREVPSVGWLAACEFTRPTRRSRRCIPAAISAYPLMVFVVAITGGFHRPGDAYLGMYRPGARARVRALVAVVTFAVLLAGLSLLAGMWALAVPIAGAVAVAATRVAGVVLRPRSAGSGAADGQSGRHLPPWALRAPKATWEVSVACARPVVLDAVDTVFLPYAKTVVGPGETVGAVAANLRLAEHYTEAGFAPVGRSPYRLQYQG